MSKINKVGSIFLNILFVFSIAIVYEMLSHLTGLDYKCDISFHSFHYGYIIELGFAIPIILLTGLFWIACKRNSLEIFWGKNFYGLLINISLIFSILILNAVLLTNAVITLDKIFLELIYVLLTLFLTVIYWEKFLRNKTLADLKDIFIKNKTQECPFCQEIIPANATVCKYCCEKLEENSTKPDNKKISKRDWLFISIFAIIVILLIQGFVLLKDYLEPSLCNPTIQKKDQVEPTEEVNPVKPNAMPKTTHPFVVPIR